MSTDATDPDPDPPRPRGPALRPSDADLDAAAGVDGDDLESGARLWRRVVPEEIRGLIDATDADEDQPEG